MTTPFPIIDNPNTPTPPPHKRRRPNRWGIYSMVGGGIFTLAIASAVLIYILRQHTPKPATTQRHTSQATVAPTNTQTSSSVVTYTSNGTDLNLSFTYPTNWTVAPLSGNNSNDQPITSSSPLVSIPDASGTSQTGKVIVSIRPGRSQIDELTAGSAIVVQNSIQFAYSNPTSSQHQYPYLTFIHIEGGQNTAGAFDEVMVTGITSFTKGQSITSDSISQLDPIITARFYACSSTACSGSNQTPLTITNDTWQNNVTMRQVQALFASLALH